MHGRCEIDYAEMISKVSEKHQVFMAKYRMSVSKVISEDQLHRITVYARLALVAKVLVDAKIIDSYHDIDIVSVGKAYASSLALCITNVASSKLYLLNGGNNVVVSEGLPDNDAIHREIASVTDGKPYYRKYYNVLDESFDWTQMAMDVVDAIHITVYKKTEVLKNFIASSIPVGGE